MHVALVTAKIEYQLLTARGACAMAFDTAEAAQAWLDKRNAKLTQYHAVADLTLTKVTTLYEAV